MVTTPTEQMHDGPVDLERLDPVEFDLDLSATLWSGKLEQSTWRLTANLLAPEDALDENAREPIFKLDGWMFPLRMGPELSMFLDEDADSAEFIPLTDDYGLRAEYETGFGSQLVIVNHARLDPRWRGLGGVGLYLTGISRLMLRDWAACFALHPAPFELSEKYGVGKVPNNEWKSGTKRLTRLWRTLGFEPALGDNLVLDPSLNVLDKAISRLGRRLGIRSHD